MRENKQPLDQHDENTAPLTKEQPYARSTGTSIRTGLARDENGPTITHQSDAHPADRGMNSGLSRALVGGLIGATLGTLAGALANKRTVLGANYALKGVGDGVKTVAEGINYAVVGGLVNAVNDTAENALQFVVGALDAAKGATEDVKLFNNQSSNLNEERLVVVELEQPVEKHEENLDSITSRGDAQSVGTGTGNGLAKAAIAGVVGSSGQAASC